MFTVLALAATHVVALGAGAFGWPHVQTLVTSFKANRAVKSATALLTAEKARLAALESAAKVVAAQPKPVAATGPTGPTGA